MVAVGMVIELLSGITSPVRSKRLVRSHRVAWASQIVIYLAGVICGIGMVCYGEDMLMALGSCEKSSGRVTDATSAG